MCLESVSTKKAPKSGYFWKVFTGLSLDGQRTIAWLNGRNLEFNKWHKAEALDRSNSFPKYPLGFHGFIRKKDAISYDNTALVLRVKFRKGLVRGVQRDGLIEKNYDCIVAKEIFIPKPK